MPETTLITQFWPASHRRDAPEPARAPRPKREPVRRTPKSAAQLDLELTERAARAVGIKVVRRHNFNTNSEELWQPPPAGVFEPLLDSEQALDLVVRRRLSVQVGQHAAVVRDIDSGLAWREEIIEGTDPHAALRRAIVRATAKEKA